jgi:predicted RNA-binding Zn ribbon-like protein
MPEHRVGTPDEYYALESFLWREFENVDEWLEWTNEYGLGETATSTREVFEQALALRSALRWLEGANNGEAVGESARIVINDMIDELGVRPSISRNGEVEISAADATGRNAPLGAILVSALGAMAAGDWQRFKLCRDPECQASYYDASRNGTKVWCSMDSCGSRNKMRRLRQRQEA